MGYHGSNCDNGGVMSIDFIGQPHVYGTPLFSPFDLDDAQVVVILEDPGDPNQPKRSAEALLQLGTSEHDDVLVQAPNQIIYGGEVITRLHELTRNTFGIFDFSHDPDCWNWDLDEVYLEVNKINLEIHGLQCTLKELGLSKLSSAESEKYLSVAKRVFDDLWNAPEKEEQVVTALNHQNLEEIAHTKSLLEKEIKNRQDRKLRALVNQYFPMRQTALIEKLGERIDQRAGNPEKMLRRIYVLCESAHGYVNPKTNIPDSSEVERLINFVWKDKKKSITIIDASSDACMKKPSDTAPAG